MKSANRQLLRIFTQRKTLFFQTDGPRHSWSIIKNEPRRFLSNTNDSAVSWQVYGYALELLG